MKKVIIILVVVVLVGGGGGGVGYYFYRKSVKAAEVVPVTAAVERGSIRALIESTGRVASNLDVDIKCKASGAVVRLPKDVSDDVREGDLLLELDPVDEQRDVDQSEANMEAAAAKLRTAQQNLEIAKADLETSATRANAALLSATAKAQDAKSRFERMAQLLAKQLVSKEDYDTAATAEKQSEADVQNAQAAVADLKSQEMALEVRKQDVASARAQAKSNEIALAQAKQRYDDTKVYAVRLSESGGPTAPAPGLAATPATQPAGEASADRRLASKDPDPASPALAAATAAAAPWPPAATQPAAQPGARPIVARVSARPVQIGQIIASGITNVGGGTTIMTLSDLSQMFVYASVDESDIGRVALGQNVIVTADAFPDKRFRGRVVRIATRGVNVSNVVTFEVKIELTDEKKTLLRPEMTANVKIVVAESRDALIVPWDAVVRKQGKSTVTVVKDGKNEERPVEVGINDGTHYEITSGLTQGETVLVQKNGADSKWRNDPNGQRRTNNPGMMMGGPPGGGRRG